MISNVFNQLPRGFIGIYVDIYSAKNLAGFAKMLASAVIGALDGRMEKAMSALAKFFRNCRPTATPQSDGTVKFSFDITAENAEASLKDVFDYLKAREKRVVIAIDEFQQVREFPEEGVEALIRSYIQFIPWVRFIFAGSRRHLMTEMFVMPQGAFYQSTQIMNLGVISEGKYLSFAKGFFEAEGWTLDDGVFERLYRRFDGVTWYIQAVLNKVWETRTSLLDDTQVDRAVVELCEERALVYHDLLAAQNGPAPHPFSRAELKKVIGTPQFGKKAKLSVVRTSTVLPDPSDPEKRPPKPDSNAPKTACVRVKIPMADGNPNCRVFAYNVVVVGDDPKKRYFKSEYFSGVNLGIGHEPNGGVTTVDIPVTELPAGKTLTVAVRPVSSLGTKGKAIGTTFKV